MIFIVSLIAMLIGFSINLGITYTRFLLACEDLNTLFF